MQDYVNLIYREEEREMLPLCAAEGIGVIPWSPLARGRLTRPWGTETARTETDEFGKTLYHDDAADKAVVEAVAKVAEARGVTRAQIATAWVLQKPMVTAPIIGATKPSHLDDAIAAVELTLAAEEIALARSALSAQGDRRLQLSARHFSCGPPTGKQGALCAPCSRHFLVRQKTVVTVTLLP